jgi:glycosyltransferase involved in cell wall biosynthesis
VRAVIATRLFPPEGGAAAFRLAALARALAGRGAQVRVLTTHPPRSVRSVAWRGDGIEVRRWPVLRDRAGSVRGYIPFASFDVPLLARLLLTRRLDVVVVEPPPTTGAAVRVALAGRRVPYVYYAGDVSSSAAAGVGVPAPLIAVLRRLESWVMRGAAEVLAVSDGVAREVTGLGVPDDRITVVGTGVDSDVFFIGDAGGEERDELVYAGTMSEIQGAEVFVRAFARVAGQRPDSRLVMLGDGAQRSVLEQLAEELAPGRVDFLGQVPGEEVAERMRRARAGLASLHPGRGYDFAFPTKMFVATGCGTPVIYAGPGPGRMMVDEHDLGWAVDWDVEQVAGAMWAALGQPPSRARREQLAHWTLERASQRQVASLAAERVAAAVS